MAPLRFEDAMEALRVVREGRTLLLDLGGMESPLAQRLVDFVSGGACALHCHGERLAERVFLVASAPPTLSAVNLGAGKHRVA